MGVDLRAQLEQELLAHPGNGVLGDALSDVLEGQETQEHERGIGYDALVAGGDPVVEAAAHHQRTEEPGHRGDDCHRQGAERRKGQPPPGARRPPEQLARCLHLIVSGHPHVLHSAAPLAPTAVPSSPRASTSP